MSKMKNLLTSFCIFRISRIFCIFRIFFGFLSFFGFFSFYVLCSIGLMSCGKGSGVSDFPTPSFVNVNVWLSGPPAKADLSGAALASYKLSISGCSTDTDNRVIDVVPDGKEHIENLTEGSAGCLAALVSLEYGPTANTDTYLPIDKIDFAGAMGETKKFVGSKYGNVLVVAIEGVPVSPLTHNEVINFSVMPEKGENRLPAFVTSTSFAGTSDLPNAMISQIVDAGVIGTNSHGLLVMVECLEPRALSVCGSQNLLDMRFWSGVAPAEDPVISDVQTLAANDAALIIPHEVELWRNGFRFNLMIPKNADGTFVAKSAFLLRNGDSYRYMVLDIKSMLPGIF